MSLCQSEIYLTYIRDQFSGAAAYQRGMIPRRSPSDMQVETPVMISSGGVCRDTHTPFHTCGQVPCVPLIPFSSFTAFAPVMTEPDSHANRFFE